jgi:hypothetical protein
MNADATPIAADGSGKKHFERCLHGLDALRPYPRQSALHRRSSALPH